MKFRVEVVCISDAGQEHRSDGLEMERNQLAMETLGLNLCESKWILENVQAFMVAQQTAEDLKRRSRCPDCGNHYSSKGGGTIEVKTLFGAVEVANPRWTPQGKGRLIPAQAFEHERNFLLALPPHLPAPYQIHERSIDQYGYVAFDANYYWVPEQLHGEITVLEYDRHLVLCQGRRRLLEYPLAPDGVRSQTFAPKDAPPPRGQPPNRKHSSTQEEAHLRALDPAVSVYLDFCLQSPGLQRHVFLRRLFLFSRRLTPELFVASVRRAHQYHISRLDVLERIAQLLLTQGLFEPITPEIDETFRQRDTYQQGALTDPPDLSAFQVPPTPMPNAQPPEPNPEPPTPDSHG